MCVLSLVSIEMWSARTACTLLGANFRSTSIHFRTVSLPLRLNFFDGNGISRYPFPAFDFAVDARSCTKNSHCSDAIFGEVAVILECRFSRQVWQFVTSNYFGNAMCCSQNASSKRLLQPWSLKLPQKHPKTRQWNLKSLCVRKFETWGAYPESPKPLFS